MCSHILLGAHRVVEIEIFTALNSASSRVYCTHTCVSGRRTQVKSKKKHYTEYVVLHGGYCCTYIFLLYALSLLRARLDALILSVRGFYY